jgi:hypothetical protein
MRWEEKPDSIARLILITCSSLSLTHSLRLFSRLVTNFHLLIGSACLCSIMLALCYLYGNNFPFFCASSTLAVSHFSLMLTWSYEIM